MLDEQAVARIIEHMNDDHADALLLYAQAFAGRSTASAAHLVSFDERGMQIRCTEDGRHVDCRVEFDRTLQSAGDARQVLVAMSAQARERLGLRAG